MPQIRIGIDKVGIEGLRVPITRRNNGSAREHLASVDLKIHLSAERRGVHMSRLVEAINDAVRGSEFESFDGAGEAILNRLNSSHGFLRGEVGIAATLVLERMTPATGRPSLENFEVSTTVLANGRSLKKSVAVKAVGNTLCPHMLELSGAKTHAQRAEIQLEVRTDFEKPLSHEDLITICEQSFSSPTFTLLKSQDELFLVNKMYSNPKFVEDVARDCYRLLKMRRLEGRATIRVKSYESIHKHVATCEIEREL